MIKKVLFLFALHCVIAVSVAQYYEFTWNSNNGFQQWCSETYDVYFNTEWVAWI